MVVPCPCISDECGAAAEWALADEALPTKPRHTLEDLFETPCRFPSGFGMPSGAG
jgi:hypothetical protein